jgi:putative NIF3 family GTP cyclohydrolase 1 type 2
MPNPVAKTIMAALAGGLAVYSSHTNWDSSPEGVNVILAHSLGLSDLSPITPPRDGEWGMGAIGELRTPATVDQLARSVRELWGLSAVMAYGDSAAALSRVALCGGAGAGVLHAAICAGAEVLITADVGYHILLCAQLSRTRLIVANHGEMERVSLPNLRKLVCEVTDLEVVLLENNNWTPLII